MADTGDAYTAPAETGSSRFSSSANTDSDLESMLEQLCHANGGPKRVSSDKFKKYEARIFSLFGAKNNADKEAVRFAITYIAVIYGTGTNIDTSEIIVTAVGLPPQVLSSYIGPIVDQRYYRRFMANYSERAVQMMKNSHGMRNMMRERSIRGGVPTTDIETTIDFLDVYPGATDRQIATRIGAKYSALARSNNQGKTGQERSAAQASAILHHHHDVDQNDVVTEL